MRPPRERAKLSEKLAARAISDQSFLVQKWERYGDGEKDQTQRRGRRALIVGGTPEDGGLIYDPRITWAKMVQRKMRPIRIPKTIVYDAEGKVIAEIVVDPVTGKRERRNVSPLQGS